MHAPSFGCNHRIPLVLLLSGLPLTRVLRVVLISCHVVTVGQTLFVRIKGTLPGMSLKNFRPYILAHVFFPRSIRSMQRGSEQPAQLNKLISDLRTSREKFLLIRRPPIEAATNFGLPVNQNKLLLLLSTPL